MSIKPYPPDQFGNQRWLLDWREGRQRKRIVFTGTKPQARRLMAERKAEKARVAWAIPSDISFGDAAKQFIQSKESAGRRDSYMALLRHLLEGPTLRTGWGSRKLETISPADIDLYLQLRAGKSPRTRAKELTMLGTFFGWCIRRRLITANPVVAVDRPVVPKRMVRWLLPSEYARVREQADPCLREVIDVLVATGLRAGELCRLQRTDIKGGSLIVRDRKGHDDLPIPCSGWLLTVLLRQKGKANEPLFLRENGTPWSRTALHHRITNAAARAGIQKIGAHTMRHTCASWCIAAGVPKEKVQQLLGHSTITMTERYAHASNMNWNEERQHLPAPLSKNCPLSTLPRATGGNTQLPGQDGDGITQVVG